MSNVVGSLVVKLSAHTAAFNTGLSKMGKTVRSTTAGITSSFARMFSKTNILLTTLAGAGFTALIKRQMETIDATAKMSDRLGIATEELLKLRYAAKIAGAGEEGMNKGLEQLTKRLGEARMGTGEARYALETLGLSANKLAEMPLDEAFRSIADEIAKLPTQADRAAASYQLMGRRGISLVNTFALGRKGLEKYGEELKKMGGLYNRLDAAKVEAANDAITKMGASMSGLFNKLSIELAPFIKIMADNLATSIADAGSASKGLETSTSTVAAFMASMADSAQSVYVFLSRAYLAYAKFAKSQWEKDLNWVDRMTGDTDESKAEWLAYWTKAVNDTERDLASLGRENWGAGLMEKRAEFIKKIAAEIATQKQQTAGQDDLDRLNELKLELIKWHEKIQNIGKSEREVYLNRMKAKDYSEEELGPLKALTARYDEINELADVAKRTEEFIKSLQRAWADSGKSAEEIKLNELIRAGAPDWLITRAKNWIEMLKEQQKAAGASDYDLPGAMERGSTEAYSTIVRSRADSGEREQTRILAKTLDNETEQTSLQKLIADNTKQMPKTVSL